MDNQDPPTEEPEQQQGSFIIPLYESLRQQLQEWVHAYEIFRHSTQEPLLMVQGIAGDLTSFTIEVFPNVLIMIPMVSEHKVFERALEVTYQHTKTWIHHFITNELILKAGVLPYSDGRVIQLELHKPLFLTSLNIATPTTLRSLVDVVRKSLIDHLVLYTELVLQHVEDQQLQYIHEHFQSSVRRLQEALTKEIEDEDTNMDGTPVYSYFLPSLSTTYDVSYEHLFEDIFSPLPLDEALVTALNNYKQDALTAFLNRRYYVCLDVLDEAIVHVERTRLIRQRNQYEKQKDTLLVKRKREEQALILGHLTKTKQAKDEAHYMHKVEEFIHILKGQQEQTVPRPFV